MKQYFDHKGYIGSIEASLEDHCLYGQIEFINDLISYQGDNLSELEASFKESVDDYLATCIKQGKEPDRPFSGTFNIRIGPELHKTVAIAAKLDDCSINEYVKQALVRSTASATSRSEKHYHFHYSAEESRPFSFSQGGRKWSPAAQMN